MGDLGGGARSDEPSLKDRRLEERAIRNGWAVPDNVKVKILQRLAGIIDPETSEGAKAEVRYVIQAAKVMAQADLRQQALDLAREKAAADRKGAEDLEGMLKAAAEYDRTHGQEDVDMRQ